LITKGKNLVNLKKSAYILVILIINLSIPLFNNCGYKYQESLEFENYQILINNIIGEDNRERITPTTDYPWSSIVQLYVTWGAESYICSGAMISKNHVLTAGHCVYAQSRGGWADSIKVTPGADNGNEPFGHAWAINVRCFSRWINNEMAAYDFAVITLDSDIGLQTGWMELYPSFPWSSIYTGLLNTAGYPYDLNNGINMYWTYDNGDFASEYTHYYYLDVAGGQSGSPVWFYDGTTRYILSIIAYSKVGVDINFGPRINWNRRDCINNWITADETSIDKPDLAFESNTFANFTPTLGGAGLTNFEVSCKIINVGTSIPGPFTVSYYASNDTTFSTEDYHIGTDIIPNLAPTESIDSQWSGILPSNIPSGSYYVGWILDINDNIDEFNENNNWHFIWDYMLQIDATAPTAPVSCDQLNGTTFTDVWQNEVNDPSFNWSSSFDLQTGVEGYYYYWGSDPNGTSASFTTSPELDPAPVSSGSYYLRVRAKDNIGNNASWTTLYVFKYDGSPPENPITCDQLAGSTESGVWQNATSDPYFIWSEGTDSHTDVHGYYYYWGPDPYGTSDSFTTYTFYNPPYVSTGNYYLRICTIDSLGNKAPWITLYNFKYYEVQDKLEDSSRNTPYLINNFLLFGILGLSALICSLLVYYATLILRKYRMWKNNSRF
jgi:V8-like Glu-specific endopeptidase